MKTYLCRWPNGDCSFVAAKNRTEACWLLDEEGSAEEDDLIELASPFAIHFILEDDGVLSGLASVDDASQGTIEALYPALEALEDHCMDVEKADGEIMPAVREAVGNERNRLPCEIKKLRREARKISVGYARNGCPILGGPTYSASDALAHVRYADRRNRLLPTVLPCHPRKQ